MVYWEVLVFENIFGFNYLSLIFEFFNKEEFIFFCGINLLGFLESWFWGRVVVLMSRFKWSLLLCVEYNM